MMEHEEKQWCVYLIQSEVDATFYVGMAIDVTARIKEHNTGKSRFTKGHMPWKLIYSEVLGSRTEARDKEKYYKTTNGKRKLLTELGLYNN